MSTHPEETEPTSSGVAVPNVTDNARSGLDHEPLTPRKTTLVGRGDGEQQAEATGVPSEGTEVAPGETGELTGDGSGQALPPVEEQGGEAIAPDGAPVGDASEQGSGDDSSGAGGPETPASDDASSSEQPDEG